MKRYIYYNKKLSLDRAAGIKKFELDRKKIEDYLKKCETKEGYKGFKIEYMDDDFTQNKITVVAYYEPL